MVLKHLPTIVFIFSKEKKKSNGNIMTFIVKKIQKPYRFYFLISFLNFLTQYYKHTYMMKSNSFNIGIKIITWKKIMK